MSAEAQFQPLSLAVLTVSDSRSPTTPRETTCAMR